ncbi:hypothetical protein C8J57DRAFT_1508242 [Mycena rebaudengoi]|nr:hypothetical protein C8J57DRAFT_1508242 [Mycena rebaudengoi]
MPPAHLSGCINSLSDLLRVLNFESPHALCHATFDVDFHAPLVAAETAPYVNSDGDIFETAIFGKVIRTELQLLQLSSDEEAGLLLASLFGAQVDALIGGLEKDLESDLV